MSDGVKKVLLVLVAIVAGFWAISTILSIVSILVFKIIIPILIIGAIGYGLYTVFGRKALGGGRRRTLP